MVVRFSGVGTPSAAAYVARTARDRRAGRMGDLVGREHVRDLVAKVTMPGVWDLAQAGIGGVSYRDTEKYDIFFCRTV